MNSSNREKTKRGAPTGNLNALEPGEHDSVLVRITKPDIDLVYDALALDGNFDPSRLDIQEAVLYAVRQVYRRKVEDAEAIIV